MSDFALQWDPASLAADLSLEANDLKPEGGLRTAILISLFTDRRAEGSDILPDGEIDRRGWWADEFNSTPGDKIGSRLWLLTRSKQEQSVLDRAEEYTREALAWLLEDKVATAVDVAASFLTGRPGLLLTITVHRPNTDPATYRFGTAWAVEESRV